MVGLEDGEGLGAGNAGVVGAFSCLDGGGDLGSYHVEMGISVVCFRTVSLRGLTAAVQARGFVAFCVGGAWVNGR